VDQVRLGRPPAKLAVDRQIEHREVSGATLTINRVQIHRRCFGRNGALRPASPRRIAALPDVPTMAEAGVPLEMSAWFLARCRATDTGVKPRDFGFRRWPDASAAKAGCSIYGRRECTK
jgi:hypothetical protein